MSRSLLVGDRSSVNEPTESTNSPQQNEVKKPPYQLDQQVKFLHLKAEVESLLQQLQSLQQQRLATASNDTASDRH